LILASIPRKSLSHSTHHHAEIQHKAIIVMQSIKFSNQLNYQLTTTLGLL